MLILWDLYLPPSSIPSHPELSSTQLHPCSPRVKLHHSATPFLTLSICSIHLQTNSVKSALVSTSFSTLAGSGFQLGFPDSGEWRKAQSITTPGLPQSHPLLHSATLCAAGKQNVLSPTNSYRFLFTPWMIWAFTVWGFCVLSHQKRKPIF